MASPCKQVQEQIAGYVDRELEPAQANTVSRHLQDCPGCAEEANAQQRMKDWVRGHSSYVSTPVRVRAEIRRRLDEETSGFSFGFQLQQLFQRQPVPGFATAIVLMLLSGLATYFVFHSPGQSVGGDEQFTTGSIEGEIICVDCDLLDLIDTPYVHDATHRVGLRCKDGHIWSLLRSEKSRELSNNYHRHVRINGQLFQQIQYIEVKDFSFI